MWLIGLPLDILCGYQGKTLLIECKSTVGKRNPKPARYTALQRDFMQEWRGGPVATVTDVSSALRALETLKG